MKLKDILPYVFEDCIILVEDAKDGKYEYVDDFISNDKAKVKLYEDAEVSVIMPHDIDYIQINVCINY